jgi:hypothetical protein
MTTGHAQDTIEALGRDCRMIRTFLGLEVAHEPDTPFVYNTGATYILSAILQKLTGETLLDYLRPRLLEPLGITEATWPTSKEGVTLGGWGLSITTDSLAKFSQLLLQRGEWEGRQLVPAAWIDEATKKQVDNSSQDNSDWQQGYGFQFWRARHNTYRGDGAFGQYCLVIPDHDATLVITSASPDMQEVMDIIWEHLLPALQGASGDGTARPPRLELLPPTGSTPSGNGRTYEFEANYTGITAVRLDPDGTGTFTMTAGSLAEHVGVPDGTTQDLVFVPGSWREDDDKLQSPPQRLVTSAYGDGDTFVATVRYLETPFVATMRCRVVGDTLEVDLRFNVSFGPLESTLTSRSLA